MVPTVPADHGTHAIIYRNGSRIFVPQYRQDYVMRLKALIPPHTRIFHGGHNASYTVISPHDRLALRLTEEYFPGMVKIHTTALYEYPGDDHRLVLQQRRREQRRTDRDGAEPGEVGR